MNFLIRIVGGTDHFYIGASCLENAVAEFLDTSPEVEELGEDELVLLAISEATYGKLVFTAYRVTCSVARDILVERCSTESGSMSGFFPNSPR